MKKLLLPIVLLSIATLLGCSISMTEIEGSIQSTIDEFFNDVNDFGKTDNSELLNHYFTINTSTKEDLITYLTTSEDESYNEQVNHEVDNVVVSKYKNWYRAQIEYKVISKESNSILLTNSMNLYFEKINNQFKITAADYGG